MLVVVPILRKCTYNSSFSTKLWQLPRLVLPHLVLRGAGAVIFGHISPSHSYFVLCHYENEYITLLYDAQVVWHDLWENQTTEAWGSYI